MAPYSRRLEPLPLVRQLSVASSSSSSSNSCFERASPGQRSWLIADTSSGSDNELPAQRLGGQIAATKDTELASHGASPSTAKKNILRRGARASSDEPRGSGVLSTARHWPGGTETKRESGSSHRPGVLSSVRPLTDAERRQAEVVTVTGASAAAPVELSSPGPARDQLPPPGVAGTRSLAETLSATLSDKLETSSGPAPDLYVIQKKTKGNTRKQDAANTKAPVAKARSTAAVDDAGDRKSANVRTGGVGEVCEM